MFKLHNTVRSYAWGDTEAIARLRGVAPSGDPEAEMWIGAHRGAPSLLPDGSSLAEAEPDLPFLLKILAAGRALSIQTHPDARQAQTGFAADNAAGLAVDDPARNYVDDRPKPELVHALSEFHALCGFRPLPAICATFERVAPVITDGVATDALARLLTILHAGQAASTEAEQAEALRQAVHLVLSDADCAELAQTVATVAWPPAGHDAPSRAASAVDPAVTAAELAADYPRDPGILVALMLRRHLLKPGQSLALGAGILHAYIRGLAVEIMDPSDNVIRGGLTSKHIDVEELCAITRFSTAAIEPALPGADGTIPAAEGGFKLQRHIDPDPVELSMPGPLVVLVTSGCITVSVANSAAEVAAGESVYLPASTTPVRLQGSGMAFVASGT